MAFKLGRKVLIVNSPEQAQILFYAQLASGTKNLVESDDDFQGVVAYDELVTSPDTQDAEGAGFLPVGTAASTLVAQADFMRILGFGDFVGADILDVTGSKGIAGQKQISTLTITTNVPVTGEELVIDVNYQSADFRGEFASHASDYRKKRSVVISTVAGDTPTTIAAKIVADLKSQGDSGWAAWITASAVAGVVTVSSTDAKVSFKLVASGSAVASGKVTGVAAVTTAGYAGRNTYEQLKNIRLETVNGPYAESFLTEQLPIKGAKYSQYTIRKSVKRPDLSGSNNSLNVEPTGVFEFVLYVNEASAAAIQDITFWLNANVAKRIMYTSTTAAGVIGGDPATTQTVVDSTSPFSTNLV